MVFLLYYFNRHGHPIIFKAVILINKLDQSGHNVFDCFLLASSFMCSFVFNVIVLTDVFAYVGNPIMIAGNESFALAHCSHYYIQSLH